MRSRTVSLRVVVLQQLRDGLWNLRAGEKRTELDKADEVSVETKPIISTVLERSLSASGAAVSIYVNDVHRN